MVRPDRPPRDLVAVLEAIRAEPFRYGLFQALRLIEGADAGKPRMGRPEGRATAEPVRLGQKPALEFAPATLAEVEEGTDGRPPRLLVYGFGLFGPNGPMPRHLTEHLIERRVVHKDQTVARFADIFHHRLLTLFYRAWADAEPTVSHDRPDDDPFAGYVASLIGLGLPSLRDRDALPDGVKLHFAGRLAGQARNADGLRAMIGTFFGLPAEVNEFVRAWMDLPEELRWRLGDRRSGALGGGLTVGARVMDAQHRFRVVLGPMGLADYRRMLPGGTTQGSGLGRLVALVRTYAGDEHAWDVRLVLRAAEVPRLRLDGSAQLGWTSWLPRPPAAPDAGDLVFDPSIPRAAPPAPRQAQEVRHGGDQPR